MIRDAFITGFDTVNIDYNRLLTSLTVIKKRSNIELAYNKNAISVIENVVYAHDAERKWIQNHPIVLYENYLLQNIISNISAKINTENKKLFSYSSLTNQGQSFDNQLTIKLLCDDDIVFLMKNVFLNDCSDEYFERRKRRHPIWKSEAEYKAFFIGLTEGGGILTNFETALKSTVLYLSKSSESWVINDSLIKKINNELAILDTIELDSDSKAAQYNEKSNILKVATFFKNYASKLEIPFDFIILMASQFNSGFAKPDFSNTNIVFPSLSANDKIETFGKIVSSYSAKSTIRDSFFYLFYKRNSKTDSIINKEDLCKSLLKEFI